LPPQSFNMNERDRIYLRDMLDAAREALTFAEGQDRSRIESDRKLGLALVKEIEIIGEAAGRVSREVVDSAPAIPWPKIVSMRNRLIHRYSEIDFDILWDTVTVSLPPLVTELEWLLSAK
jgi:uncharacterized protein with HEPN domain